MTGLVHSGPQEAVVPTAQAEKPAGHTPGVWTLGNTRRNISTPNLWTIREHEFPNYPYEGQLDDEWGVYPPLGHCGPVALVAGADNARLIAAAPELLAVAIKSHEPYVGLSESDIRYLYPAEEADLAMSLRAAIAKATGEAS